MVEGGWGASETESFPSSTCNALNCLIHSVCMQRWERGGRLGWVGRCLGRVGVGGALAVPEHPFGPLSLHAREGNGGWGGAQQGCGGFGSRRDRAISQYPCLVCLLHP